jgi:DNA-binding transcriptional LysR family regulator
MSGWDGIDEFVSVAALGSFTRGAKALGVSTTHVSRAIKALEQRLEAQLLQRTTRTVKLTNTGQSFLERCERIVQDRDEAIALVSDRSAPKGELRVTCSTAMGERFVAPIIRRFAMRHSELTVTIDLSNRVSDLIGEDYDLAIRTGAVTDPRLVAKRVASRRLYTCAAPTYLASAPRLARICDLDEHECIRGTADAWHFKLGDEDVIHPPKGRFKCNSGHAVIEACVSGLGICQLPDFYVLPYLQHGMVELLLEEFKPDEEPIWAVYPQRKHLLPKVQQVVECIHQELGPAIGSRKQSPYPKR